MSDGYSIVIPATPPSLNRWTRMSPYLQRKEKREWQTLVMAAINEKGNVCPRGLNRIEVNAVMVFKLNRNRDADNFGYLLGKWTQDVLVRQGVIPNDTPDHCVFVQPVMLIVGDRDCTFISIKEL